MIFLNTETNEYPRYAGDLELLGWVQGEPLPNNWVEVTQEDMPAVGTNQLAELNFPALVNDKWIATWTVRDMTEEEITLVNIVPKLPHELNGMPVETTPEE